MSTITHITYVIYADHLVDMGATTEQVEQYAAALDAALTEAYPDAEVTVDVRRHVSGYGAGPVCTDGTGYIIGVECDHVRAIADKVLESILA